MLPRTRTVCRHDRSARAATRPVRRPGLQRRSSSTATRQRHRRVRCRLSQSTIARTWPSVARWMYGPVSSSIGDTPAARSYMCSGPPVRNSWTIASVPNHTGSSVDHTRFAIEDSTVFEGNEQRNLPKDVGVSSADDAGWCEPNRESLLVETAVDCESGAEPSVAGHGFDVTDRRVRSYDLPGPLRQFRRKAVYERAHEVQCLTAVSRAVIVEGVPSAMRPGVREKRGADAATMSLPAPTRAPRAATCGCDGASLNVSTGVTHASVRSKILTQWSRSCCRKAAPTAPQRSGHVARSSRAGRDASFSPGLTGPTSRTAVRPPRPP